MLVEGMLSCTSDRGQRPRHNVRDTVSSTWKYSSTICRHFLRNQSKLVLTFTSLSLSPAEIKDYLYWSFLYWSITRTRAWVAVVVTDRLSVRSHSLDIIFNLLNKQGLRFKFVVFLSASAFSRQCCLQLLLLQLQQLLPSQGSCRRDLPKFHFLYDQTGNQFFFPSLKKYLSYGYSGWPRNSRPRSG